MDDLKLEHPHSVHTNHPILGGMIVRPVARVGTFYRVEWVEGQALVPADMLTPLPRLVGDSAVKLVELVREEKNPREDGQA